MAGINDARRLTLPMSAVVGVCIALIGILGFLFQIQSDVRNINTKMDGQKETTAADERARTIKYEADTKAQNDRMAAVEKALNEIRAQMKLDDYDHRTLIKDSINSALERRRP